MFDWIRTLFQTNSHSTPQSIRRDGQATRSRNTQANSTEAIEETIRQTAYYLWESDGKPDGKADYYWSKAAAIVTSKQQ